MVALARCFILAPLLLAVAAARGDEITVDFARDVRPILARNCFQCHGPDAAQREAELRLDTHDGALGARKSGAPFVAGNLDDSEAWRRINSDDPDEQMPPADSKKALTPREIALIGRWIEQGAKWSQHWAFVAPTPQKIPAVRDAGWPRNPIDAFVLARLEREGLPHAPEADKVTLLRRLSLDLIGLPPTIDEVDNFLADDSDEAYRKQVDRLLDSPHYGERWGRHWLDAARYADSDGFEKDKPRFVWFYRDWVVSALNRDLPYDQFVIEQIAGDQLPDATQDQRVATGFLRNSMINEEGGVDPEQFRMEAMFDRMDAIGKGVLGITIQCAQCHDHKYDPLTQEEYYRTFAFLNNDHEANVAVYTAAEQLARTELLRQIAAIEADLQHRRPDWASDMAKWETQVRDDQPKWTVVHPIDEDLISLSGQRFERLKDGSLLAQSYAPTKHDATFHARIGKGGKITAMRLELLNDPNLPLGGPGRSIFGTAALTEFFVEAAPADAPEKITRPKFASATADVNPTEAELPAIYDDKSGKRRVIGPIAYALDDNDLTAWGTDIGPHRRNQPRKAVFALEQPLEAEGELLLTFHLVQKHGGWNSDDNQTNNLGRFRLSVTSAADAVADPLPRGVRAILEIPADRRTPAQTGAVFSYWRTTVDEFKEANDRIEELWRKHPEGASQLALQPRDNPRPTHILQRGDFLKPQAEVSPGVPAFLHALPEGAPPTRLTFARWLVDRRSPTTARAMVNRVWQAYFGIGLVGTSEDLGSQCETPSHPELLDWLAVAFMERGWSLKELHRLIVTSATYRQSSSVTGEGYERDPYNRLLARGASMRVEAEVVRDVALAVSGLLQPRIGGPSVYPPAPAFLFEPPISYGPKVWKESTGEDRYRRAFYTFRFRSVPYPMLQTFDAPNGDFSCVRRVRSNTPLQALVTLNEPLFVECAQALALRTVIDGGATDDERLVYAFRRCLARKPNEKERAVLTQLLREQAEYFSEDGANPWEFAAPNPAKPPPLPEGTTPAQLAAWTAVSRVLLNLDETISKR